MASKAALRCAAHGALAGWKCNGCGEPLCPDCAASKNVYPVKLVACSLCGEGAHVLSRHRTEAGSLWARLPGALGYPLRGEGRIGWLALAVFNGVFSLFAGPLVFFALMVSVASLFAVTRSTGRGAQQLDFGDTTDFFGDIVAPSVRFAVATAPVWLGLIFAISRNSTPLLVVVGIIGVAWVPMSLLAAALNSSLLAVVNPVVALAGAVRLGRDYFVYLGALLGCLLIGALSIPVAMLVSLLPVPVLSNMVASAVWTYPLFVAAHIGGLVLYLRGDALGWLDARDAAEAVLQKAEPRGVLPAVAKSDAHRSREAIELPPEPVDRFEGMSGPATAHAEAQRGAVPDWAQDPSARPQVLDAGALPQLGGASDADGFATAVRRAMAEGDPQAALEAWGDAGRMLPELTVAELTWLGKAAGNRGDTSAAESAFLQAAQGGASAETAPARVMLARLLDERLHRTEEAAAWMRRVVEEQGATDAAAFARKWLAKRA